MAINNEWNIKGNLGRDPEVRFSQRGTAVCRFSVAVSQGKKEDEKPPLWVSVTCFGDLGEDVANRFSKGDRVSATGRAELNEWVGRDGEKRVEMALIADSVVEDVFKDKQGGKPKQQPKPRIDPDEEPF